MHIVIDMSLLPEEELPSSCKAYQDAFWKVATNNTSHSFTILTKGTSGTPGNLPIHIAAHAVKNTMFGRQGAKWWYNYVLPYKLTKWKTDLFVTVDNYYTNSRNIPCCLFITSMDAILPVQDGSRQKRVSLQKAGKALRRAVQILTNSEHDRKMVRQLFPESGQKVQLWILDTGNAITIMPWKEKESLKTTYSGGRDYFLFAGDISKRHRLTDLLLAFSIFKKWQQSNMQLLIAGNPTAYIKEFSEKLSTYKYRSDVQVLPGLPAQVVNHLISGAYACVYPAAYDHFPLTIIKAMRAGVPVITSSIPVIREFSGNAALFAYPDNVEGFAKALQLIYKDEDLRTSIIGLGKLHTDSLTKGDPADDLWQLMLRSFH